MSLLPSTFEILPDEILMLIFRYSGSVTAIFRTFSALNERLNRILTDRRLRLLPAFLRINSRQNTFNYYYDNPLFRTLSQQLCSLQGNGHIHQLNQCFQRLISFDVEEKSRQIGDQFRSARERFRSIRIQLTPEQTDTRDAALKTAFKNLESRALSYESLQQVEDLAIDTGARFECVGHALDEFNLTKALNQFLLAHLYTVGYPSRCCLRSIQRLFEALIVSNPNLVHNRDYGSYDGSPMYYFLVYAIFRLQHFHRAFRPMAISLQKYNTILELLLFVIQSLKEVSDERLWATDCLLNSLHVGASNENDADGKRFIQCSQMEVFKMFFQETTQRELPLDELSSSMLQEGLANLIVINRMDMLEYIYRQNSFMQSFLSRADHGHKLIDIITGTRSRRRMFEHFLDKKSPEPWLTSTTLFFILLKKKECKWIKKLLRLDSTLIDRVDDDGNNPLLYVCLNVSGCRHRLIEILISMGSDLQKRNVHGEHFVQAMQLNRNRTLLKQLIEHEII